MQCLRNSKVAARFVLDHPIEVALMSMREQAHQAGVYRARLGEQGNATQFFDAAEILTISRIERQP